VKFIKRKKSQTEDIEESAVNEGNSQVLTISEEELIKNMALQDFSIKAKSISKGIFNIAIILMTIAICFMARVLDSTHNYMSHYFNAMLNELRIDKLSTKIVLISLLVFIVIIAIYQAINHITGKLEKIKPVVNSIEIIANIIMICLSMNIVTTSNSSMLSYVTTKLAQNFIDFCSDYYTTEIDNIIMRPILTAVYIIVAISLVYMTLTSITKHTEKAFKLSLGNYKSIVFILHTGLIIIFIPAILGIVTQTQLMNLLETIYGTIVVILLSILIAFLIYKYYKRYIELVNKLSKYADKKTPANYIENYKNVTLQWTLISLALVVLTAIAFAVDAL
jgi:hypothetical protein